MENAFDIAGGGLVTHGPSFGTDQDVWPDGATERRSYFIDTPAKAFSFAPEDGKSVLLRIQRDVVKFKRESTTGDYFSRVKIPAGAVEVVTTRGWLPLVAKEKK